MAKKKKEVETRMAVVLIAVVFLVTFGVFMGLRGTGQAIEIGDAPFLEEFVNLYEEEKVTYTVLPNQEAEIGIVTSTTARKADSKRFTLKITPNEDEETFALEIYEGDRAGGQPVATDILRINQDDSTKFYLEDNDREIDAVADLLISSISGTIEIKTLHFQSPDAAIIGLYDAEGNILPDVIRLEAGETFEAQVDASSSSTPSLAVNIGTLSEANEQEGYTFASLSYTAPDESAIETLDITATVRGKTTHARYTLAIGDILYALQEENYPSLKVEGENQFVLTLARKDILQPFSLPCVLDNPSTVNFFADSGLQRLLGFDTRRDESINYIPPLRSEIPQLKLFHGYFAIVNEFTEITADCTIQSILPATALPPDFVGGGRHTFTIDEGWSLFSMPGLVARPLTDFMDIPETMKVHECANDYQCEEIPADSDLVPGKVYWVYVEDDLDINYVLGE